MPLLVFLNSAGLLQASQPALYGLALFGDAQFGDAQRAGTSLNVAGRLVDITGTPIAGAVVKATPRLSQNLSVSKNLAVELIDLQPTSVVTDADGGFVLSMVDPGSIWPQINSLPVLFEAPYQIKFLFSLVSGQASAYTVNGSVYPNIWSPLPVDVLTELVTTPNGSVSSGALVQLSVDGPPVVVLGDGTVVSQRAPVTRITDSSGQLSVGLLSGLAPGAQVSLQIGMTSVVRPVVHPRRIDHLVLQVSGNEVTDATRVTSGDGKKFVENTGIYPGSQNINPNGGLEQGISGYTAKDT